MTWFSRPDCPVILVGNGGLQQSNPNDSQDAESRVASHHVALVGSRAARKVVAIRIDVLALASPHDAGESRSPR